MKKIFICLILFLDFAVNNAYAGVVPYEGDTVIKSDDKSKVRTEATLDSGDSKLISEATDCNCNNSSKSPFDKLKETAKNLQKSKFADSVRSNDLDVLKRTYADRPEIKNFLKSLDSGTYYTPIRYKDKKGKWQTVKKRVNGKLIEVMVRKLKTRWTYWCYQYVKKALQKSGLVNKYLKGESPSVDATRELEKQGFVNIWKDKNFRRQIKSYNDFPAGTVFVYSGGKNGHIEAKTTNGFESDYYSQRPRTGSLSSFNGRGRKLIGAFLLKDALAKPNLLAEKN